MVTTTATVDTVIILGKFQAACVSIELATFLPHSLMNKHMESVSVVLQPVTAIIGL